MKALALTLILVAATIFGTGGWSVSPAERGAHGARSSVDLRPPVPFTGAVVPGNGRDGSSTLSAPVQEPEQDIGTAIEAGTASYCAPTPTKCQSWGGSAKLGAMPSFRYGDRPFRVNVCRLDSSACVSVKIVSYCACGTHVIDLSPAAFRELAPLSAGIVRVTVEWGGAELPPTSTEAMP